MKNRNYIIIAIVLLIVAALFYFTNKSGTTKKELRDFAIQDTASVSKIFIVNKNNKSVLLEKKEGAVWYVNGKFVARKDAVDLILKTFKRIDVKSPVPKAQFENVVKRLSSTSVKVEVYTDDDKADKVIYIGGPTQDQYGTYMMIENSSTPFITHIPGFSGFLSSRFFLDENLWRDQTIFNYPYKMIQSVLVEDIKENKNSFKLSNMGDNSYELFNITEDKLVADFDTLKAKYYLSLYKNLSFERVASELEVVKQDSILASEPIYRLTITDTNSKITSIETFLRPNFLKAEENDNDPMFDVERMYARVNDDNELLIIQYYVFDPLFMDLNYFIN